MVVIEELQGIWKEGKENENKRRQIFGAAFKYAYKLRCKMITAIGGSRFPAIRKKSFIRNF